MEESLSLLGAIRKKFVCDRVDIRTYSPLTLAFVGDCIYDLVIRTIVVERGNTAPGVLHTKKSSIVKFRDRFRMRNLAPCYSPSLDQPCLTETEKIRITDNDMVGQAKLHHPAKHSKALCKFFVLGARSNVPAGMVVQ